jgi:hypothetical protein
MRQGCTLDPDRDVFLIFDQQKIRKRNAWQCGICSKHFATEASVDAHMLRSHLESSAGRDVCLADYAFWFFQNTTTPLSETQRDKCLATFADCFPPETSAEAFAEAVKTVCHASKVVEEDSSAFLLTLLLLVGCLGLFAAMLLVLEFGEAAVAAIGSVSLARVMLAVRKRVKLN